MMILKFQSFKQLKCAFQWPSSNLKIPGFINLSTWSKQDANRQMFTLAPVTLVKLSSKKTLNPTETPCHKSGKPVQQQQPPCWGRETCAVVKLSGLHSSLAAKRPLHPNAAWVLDQTILKKFTESVFFRLSKVNMAYEIQLELPDNSVYILFLHTELQLELPWHIKHLGKGKRAVFVLLPLSRKNRNWQFFCPKAYTHQLTAQKFPGFDPYKDRVFQSLSSIYCRIPSTLARNMCRKSITPS